VKPFVTVAVLAGGMLATIVPNLQAEVTAEQVRQAIDGGVSFLKSRQQPDGLWPDIAAAVVGGQQGGVSALCTLALLNAGVDPSDPAMQRALHELRAIPPESTYVVALQTMALARAEPEKDIMLIRRNVQWLQKTQIHGGPCGGSWSYTENTARGNMGDNSNSQFALLALHEAERAGVSADDQTWRLALRYWKNRQNQDGSWGYNLASLQGTGSMTCAGITSLAIASDRLQPGGASVVGDRIECCSSHPDADANRIEKGWKWLGRNYSISHNPQGNGWYFYYLYGLERTGRLTAQRFIPLVPAALQNDAEGRADWYREGSEWLIAHPVALETGVWQGNGNEGNALISTSMALLFLSKGRWPVLMSKMQHAPGVDWNHHRSDAANLTRFAESRWKQDLTWQIVDLRAATVEELVQTPVMYLSGSQDPVPEGEARRKELAHKIRDYLDRGGFLFAVADCDGVGFDRGFRQLMQEALPEPEYRLRLLEPEHPIWRAEGEIEPRQLRPVLGVEFGCRTSVAYVPPEPMQNPRPSLSCLWELSRPGREVKYGRAVQDQVDAAMMLGLNVLAYATNRELKSKEHYFKPAFAHGPADRVERGRMAVATLRHPGGCSIAPRAVVNLMDAAAAELKIRTKVREELLDITDDSLFDYQLAFMHGRTAFRLTDAERQRLRQYVERGGVLLADSVCASAQFTASFRNEMKLMFPNQALERIPATDPLWTTKYGGYDLHVVSRRDPGEKRASSKSAGGPLTATTRRVPPELEGVKFGDRWGVIFSQYDLSCALEKRDSLECQGYTRDDAARIGLNVVLYSLQQ
jgi:hypothetical protein